MVIFENVTAAVPGGRYVHNFSGDHVIFDDADLVCLHERPDDVSRMVKICHECSDQIACISCMYRKRVLYVLVAFELAPHSVGIHDQKLMLYIAVSMVPLLI